MTINFGLINPESQNVVSNVFDYLQKQQANAMIASQQQGQLLMNNNTNNTIARGQDLNYSANMAQVNQQANQAQNQAQYQQGLLQNQQQGLGITSQNNQAQQALAQQEQNRLGQGQQFQQGIDTAKLGMAEQDQGMKVQDRNMGLMKQAMLIDAAKQGLPGIRSFYVAMGDYKSAQDLDKNDADYNQAILNNKKSAFDIADANERYKALQISNAVAQGASTIAGIQDPQLQQIAKGTFINNINQRYGTNYATDGAGADAAFTILATKSMGTAAQMSALMQNGLTASANQDNMKAFGSTDPREVASLLTKQALTDPLASTADKLKAVSDYADLAVKLRTMPPGSLGGTGIQGTGPAAGLGDSSGGSLGASVGAYVPITQKALTEVGKNAVSDRRLLESIDFLQSTYNPSYLGAYAQGQFAVDKAADRLGLTGPTRDQYLAGATQFNNALERLTLEYKSSNQGSAAGEKGGDMIKNAIINNSQGPVGAQSSLQGLRQQITRSYSNNLEIAQNGGLPALPPNPVDRLNSINQAIPAIQDAADKDYANNNDQAYQQKLQYVQQLMNERNDIAAKAQAALQRRNQ